MTIYNTNLASEFYVLSMLYRLGIDASLTLGNKKAVDIIVTSGSNTITTVEVKGLAGSYDWPANNILDFESLNHMYVLVSFEGDISNPHSQPSAWIIPANQLKQFTNIYRTRTVISRAKINAYGGQFLHNWSLIPRYQSPSTKSGAILDQVIGQP